MGSQLMWGHCIKSPNHCTMMMFSRVTWYSMHMGNKIEYVYVYIFFCFYCQNLVLDSTIVSHCDSPWKQVHAPLFLPRMWCCAGLQFVIGIVLCFGCHDLRATMQKISTVIGFWGVKSSTNPCKIQYYGWHSVPYNPFRSFIIIIIIF